MIFFLVSSIFDVTWYILMVPVTRSDLSPGSTPDLNPQGWEGCFLMVMVMVLVMVVMVGMVMGVMVYHYYLHLPRSSPSTLAEQLDDLVLFHGLPQ